MIRLDAFDLIVWRWKGYILVAALAALACLIGYAVYVDHHIKSIKITEQDIVRYCLDRRASHAPEAETHWACQEMGGDYYIAQGVKPNYDKYPSWKTWGLKEEPR